MGCGVVTGILHWTCGCSTIFIIGTFGQTLWMTSCVCRTTCTIIVPTNFACCWELDRCEGLHSKLCNCFNCLKSWLHFNFEFVAVGFKTRINLSKQINNCICVITYNSIPLHSCQNVKGLFSLKLRFFSFLSF